MADWDALVGKTTAHYGILENIGEGRMGEAHRARDLHLDRLVARKLLPMERLTDTVRRQRLVQEARQ
jgi:hypothetical protein